MTRIDTPAPRTAQLTPSSPTGVAGGQQVTARPAAAGQGARVAPMGVSEVLPDVGRPPSAKVTQTPATRTSLGAPSAAGGNPGSLQNLNVHDVAAGDSWASVAAQYGVSATALQAANPGAAAGALQAGTQLKIPELDGQAGSARGANLGANIAPLPDGSSAAGGAQQGHSRAHRFAGLLGGVPCLQGLLGGEGGQSPLGGSLLGLHCCLLGGLFGGGGNGREGSQATQATQARTPLDAQADT